MREANSASLLSSSNKMKIFNLLLSLKTAKLNNIGMKYEGGWGGREKEKIETILD